LKKNPVMADFAPQYNLFKIIDKLKSVLRIVFWAIFILSLAPSLVKLLNVPVAMEDLINTANIISIALFFLIEIAIEYILIPQADNKRRDDFIDNAFGSKFSPTPSVGYYDTEELERGLYKAASNLFENCFFSYSLTKAMTIRKTVLPAIVLLFVFAFAYYGFKGVPFALSLLQALFSATLLGNLAKHLLLISRLSNIHDSWINVFQHDDFKANTVNYQAQIFRIWLQYETLHSRIPSGIPDNLFKKYNKKLTQDWEVLKLRYNIK